MPDKVYRQEETAAAEEPEAGEDRSSQVHIALNFARLAVPKFGYSFGGTEPTNFCVLLVFWGGALHPFCTWAWGLNS